MRRRTLSARSAAVLLVGAFLTACGASAPGPGPARGPAPVPGPGAGSPTTTPGGAYVLGVSPTEFPPLGQCRIWLPGRPLVEQSNSGICAELQSEVPPGGWLLSREGGNPARIQVYVYDPQGDRVVQVIREYDAVSGELIQEWPQ